MTIDGPTLLRAVLRAETIAPLDREQLETLDQAIAAQVRSLPAHLTETDALQDRRLHSLRLCVQARLQQIRDDRQRAQQLIARLYQEQPPEAQAPDQAQDQPLAQLTPQEQAGRLLAAAITLLAGGSDQGGSGRPARLTPRPPTLPPGGSAINSTTQPRGRF